MKNPHLLLVDGMALLFRAFFATAVHKQFMINSSGMPTNAVQGYVRHLLTAIEHKQPTHVVVCWDMGSTTFRNEIFTQYKANREAAPIEMQPQFDLAKTVTDAFGIPNIGVSGYEADDCIGTICNKLKKEMKISVLTGDRDLLQILDENVDIILMQKGMGNYLEYDKGRFLADYGIHPVQMIDVKALMGDPSDGYPGVKGIGEKTAIKLIQAHMDIDGLLNNLESLSAGQQKKINDDIDMLHLSRRLAAIHCDVPLDILVSDCEWGIVPEKADACVEEHELKSIRNHLLKFRSIEQVEWASGSLV